MVPPEPTMEGWSNCCPQILGASTFLLQPSPRSPCQGGQLPPVPWVSSPPARRPTELNRLVLRCTRGATGLFPFYDLPVTPRSFTPRRLTTSGSSELPGSRPNRPRPRLASLPNPRSSLLLLDVTWPCSSDRPASEQLQKANSS